MKKARVCRPTFVIKRPFTGPFFHLFSDRGIGMIPVKSHDSSLLTHWRLMRKSESRVLKSVTHVILGRVQLTQQRLESESSRDR